MGRFNEIIISVLSSPIAYLINKCIETSEFPEQLKRAEVSPIFKKNDMLDKKNYRPISILPCLSKIFEGVLVDQLTSYFDEILSPFMSGFRKNHNCESVLLRYTENCRLNLDNNQVYGSLLTDLSKAFDSLKYRLLITKLDAYGVSENSCMLLASYFQERSQRVKLGNVKSKWLELSKGCPQGSLIGPLAYNIFSNDLLLLIETMGEIYNYADDNTVSCSGQSTDEVVKKLESVSSVMLQWFKANYLQANPDKFQLIMFNSKSNDYVLSISDQIKL